MGSAVALRTNMVSLRVNYSLGFNSLQFEYGRQSEQNIVSALTLGITCDCI